VNDAPAPACTICRPLGYALGVFIADVLWHITH
jgi:hypothetical protein